MRNIILSDEEFNEIYPPGKLVDFETDRIALCDWMLQGLIWSRKQNHPDQLTRYGQDVMINFYTEELTRLLEETGRQIGK